MTKVNLRKKPISGDRETLYLDFWPPIVFSSGKQTRREFLGLYLNSKARTAADKLQNRQIMDIAETVRAKRQIDIQSGAYHLSRSGGDMLLLDYMESLTKKRTPQTQLAWRGTMKHIKLSGLDKITMDQLDLLKCLVFREYLLKLVQSEKLTAFSAANYLGIFRVGLRAAYREGVISESLTERFERIKTGESKREYLLLEELNRLIATPTKSTIVRTISIFAALTGMRISDIRALQWESLRETVVVHEQGEEDLIIELHYRQVKTKKDQVLPISRQARSLMGEKSEGLVFSGIPNSRTLCETVLAWVRRAGITKHITFHCFRHTYATLQLSNGTDIATLCKLLGQSDIATTQIYAKVLDESKRNAAERVQVMM